MKKVKIPFNLEEYNKGGYEVKCGKHEARVLCTNFSSNEGSIVCAIKSLSGSTEFLQTFNKEGKVYIW